MLDDKPFDPVAAGRAILRTAATTSLGTLTEDGAPFVTLVTIASLPDGRPVLHLSDLAVHSRNLKRDDRVSLLLVAPGGEGGNPLAGGRITLTGKLRRDHAPETAARYRRATAAPRASPTSTITAWNPVRHTWLPASAASSRSLRRISFPIAPTAPSCSPARPASSAT